MWGLGADRNEPEWQVVETPFSNDLFEVVTTSRGPFAVGDGGIIAGDRGKGWAIITDDGPNVSQNQLRTLDVTDDGKRLWFAGSSGAIGCYDVETNRKYDYSYPNEMTSTWESIAVSGNTGSEKLLVANGSGEIMPCSVDGFTINWGVPEKPANKGSTMTGLAASPDGYGYGIDTSGNAFMTTRNDGWKDIGVIESQVKFYDIWAERNGRVYIAAGKGVLYRYDNSYRDWTPIGVAEKGALHAFDMYENQMVALGDGGLMYQRTDGGERWERLHTPTDDTLYDLALGDPDIAIGKGGLVLERPRGTTRAAGKSPDGDEYAGRGEVYDADPNAPRESASTASNRPSTAQQPRSEPVQPAAESPQPHASTPPRREPSRNPPQSRTAQPRQQSRESAPTQSRPQPRTEATDVTRSQNVSSRPENGDRSQKENQAKSRPQNPPAETANEQQN
ncbi:WD40/YVTN/BNR-like repeat-containing protein [Halococcus agarilyticus]|uniref:WD40/YVTN/BNR-like repeat-containing protein n=1 Tax=Halococcus agarilyticus TaxID=1232219 RepID=UPI0006775D8D|nr:hypothetical protein [Halococcus agarilyticus]